MLMVLLFIGLNQVYLLLSQIVLQVGLFSQNLSLTTIQTFYSNLPDLARDNARGFYDEIHNHIRWIYNEDTTYSETNYINNYNRELSLDLSLQAFYIYSISSLVTNTPRINDYIGIPSHSFTTYSRPLIV